MTCTKCKKTMTEWKCGKCESAEMGMCKMLTNVNKYKNVQIPRDVNKSTQITPPELRILDLSAANADDRNVDLASEGNRSKTIEKPTLSHCRPPGGNSYRPHFRTLN